MRLFLYNKYKVQIIVVDDSDCASLLMFDPESIKVLGIKAPEILDELNKVLTIFYN